MIVKIFQTRGGVTSFETNATTFGELRNDFSANGVSFSYESNIAMLVGSNLELGMDAAVLPEEDFMMGIYPRKTKAGADRKSLYAQIKKARGTYGNEAVKAFFARNYDCVEGKNYTNLSSDVLEEAVPAMLKYLSYSGTNSNVTTPETSTQVVAPQVTDDAAKRQALVAAGFSAEEIEAMLAAICEPQTDPLEEWAETVCRQHPLLRC